MRLLLSLILVGMPTASSIASPAEGEVAPAGTGSIVGEVTARRAKHVANTLVFVNEAPGEFPPPESPVDIDQLGTQFIPRRVTVLKGTVVRYKNSDPFDHNVFSPDGERFDLGIWGLGEERTYTYDKLGVYTQLCNLHPKMVGYVAVVQNPYHAWTDETGTFRIDNVPPGSYTLHVWNERREADPTEIDVEDGVDTTVSFALHR